MYVNALDNQKTQAQSCDPESKFSNLDLKDSSYSNYNRWEATIGKKTMALFAWFVYALLRRGSFFLRLSTVSIITCPRKLQLWAVGKRRSECIK